MSSHGCKSKDWSDTRLYALIATGAALALSGSSLADIVDLQIAMDGAQEATPVETTASGTGTASLDTDTLIFSWDITYNGLTTPAIAAHFHGPAAICEGAGAVIDLGFAGRESGKLSGKVKISPDMADDALMGLWYLNIHSETHPGGEIRGQVRPAPLGDPLPPIGPSNVHVQLEVVADGLTAPNWGINAPGHDDRLYVVDQPGILWNIDLSKGGKSVFLDVTDRIMKLGVFGEGSFDERGLLGVAFHPDYADNGLLYTYISEPLKGKADFTTMPEGELADHHTVIHEWQVDDPSDPDAVVNPKSLRELLRIDEPQFNHNAGAINMGPDSMLYISLGDGGGADDQDAQDFLGVLITGHGCRGNGSDATNILGTVIRIDPLGNNAANGNYGIPDDNPFLDNDFVDEIFAYGFRNPFRFSFDTDTGELYLADVGQNDIEEVNIVESGGNYGWNFKEGSFAFIPAGISDAYVTDMAQDMPDDLIDPITEYDHDDGIAIIGGFVYRGTKIPALDGNYVYGEWSLDFQGSNGRLFHYNGKDTVEFALNGQDELALSLHGFGQDANGEVYVLGNTTGAPFGDTGVVFRIAPKLGDLDADGIVGSVDLMELLGDWGEDDSPADLDMDGTVGTADLILLLGNWG